MSEKKKAAHEEVNVLKETKPELSNEEKMEQGKIEVMKVVEGVQGSEKLGELIERGKHKQ